MCVCLCVCVCAPVLGLMIEFVWVSTNFQYPSIMILLLKEGAVDCRVTCHESSDQLWMACHDECIPLAKGASDY